MGWTPNVGVENPGATGSPSPLKKARGYQQPKPPPPCQFCGIRDEEFRDSEKLDLHYVLNCLMLTNCNACAQIIEVSTLNTHLAKECAHKEQHRQCKRCRESIHVDEYAQHTASLDCLPRKPASQANRCPLCHKDIGAGERGWR